MPEIGLKFKYENGTANQNQLDLYDASVSLNGIARALAITTHAFINGEIRTHGESAHGANFYLQPSRRGSFIFEITMFVAGAISSGVFYDFVKYQFQEAVGHNLELAAQSRALQNRIEPTIGELPVTLESALYDAHRPIRQENEITLKVQRPRGEELVTFDHQTASYLRPHVIPVNEPIIGNVTRYNTLSRWGKFFDRALDHTVSFHLGPTISEYERSLITWSLHESNMGRDGTLHLTVNAVVTPTNQIKRYNVTRVMMPA